MVKTLRITFSLRFATKVNAVLYVLKHIPLLGRCFPDDVYRVRWLKGLASGGAFFWELGAAVLGKAVYLLAMVALVSLLYPVENKGPLFGHFLVFLTVVGGRLNGYLFEADGDGCPEVYAGQFRVRYRKGAAGLCPLRHGLRPAYGGTSVAVSAGPILRHRREAGGGSHPAVAIPTQRRAGGWLSVYYHSDFGMPGVVVWTAGAGSVPVVVDRGGGRVAYTAELQKAIDAASCLRQSATE